MRRRQVEGDRHFARRDRAARKGLHLPSEPDLLLGMSFMSGEVHFDLREYSARLANKLRRKPRQRTAGLLAAFDEAVAQSDTGAVRAIEESLRAYESGLSGLERSDERLASCALRCRIYLAHLGDGRACGILAGETAYHARRGHLSQADRLTLFCRSLAWSALASRINRSEARGEMFRFHAGSEVEGSVWSFRTLVVAAVEHEKEETGENAAGGKEAARASTPALPAASGQPAPGTSAAGAVVVIPHVGNANTKQGREVEREFKGFVDVALPLPPAPDMAAARRTLVAEFPWAAGIVDQFLGDLRNRSHVRLRPTVLVGPPGGGKTRFAKALATACGLPWDLVPCGGISDSAFGGTPRRWQTGEPSQPVMTIRRHGSAGPAIILDEIEKASVNRNNGAIGDVLVGMLGRETASRYLDPYVEAECDVSQVSWIMTANEVESLQAPLRDRCRVLAFPAPGPEHLAVLSRSLLERHLAETGHDRRWATPLEPYELEVLASAWAGGSIRKLERLVERLALAREQHGGQQ